LNCAHKIKLELMHSDNDKMVLEILMKMKM